MRLTSLDFQGFRNYEHAHLEIRSDINVIHGLNGHGKTSLLEAIYYTSLTQSFKTTSDRDCLNFNHDTQFFDIRANYENHQAELDEVRVYYERKNGKSIFLNTNKLATFKAHIGYIPTVLLKPDDLKLSYGGPSDRRTFIDVLLSQLSPIYLDSLMRYKKLVKQKNALLNTQRKVDLTELAAWNSRLVEHGSVIIQKRETLLQELSLCVEKLYKELSETTDIASLSYANPFSGEADIQTKFFERLEQQQAQEVAQQKCLVGPHRDDVNCLLGGKQIGKFGSQGENKTFLIAMKLAELTILGEQKKEKPILLFDDIFSELDKKRVAQLMARIEDIGQVFITTTDPKIVGHVDADKIKIEQGRVL
jgi:DNA replication and repair protein RecF